MASNRKNASKSDVVISNLPATIASADAVLENSKNATIDGDFVELDSAGNVLHDSDAEGGENDDAAKALASMEETIIKARDANVGAGSMVDNDGSGLPKALRALSIQVDKNASGSEIAKAIGADFGTYRLPLFAQKPDGTKIATGEYAHFRDSDDGLLVAHAKEAFELPNISEFFDGFRSAIDSLGAEATDWRAGIMAPGKVMGGGRGLAIFGTFTSDKPYMAAMDEVRPYAFMLASLKYGLSTRIGYTDTIAVCENTMMHAYNQAGEGKFSVTYGHRSKFGLEEIENFILTAEAAKDKYIKQAEFLASIAASPELVQLFFANVFPRQQESTKGKVYSKWASDAFMVNMIGDDANNPGAASRGNTWWRAFNTVTRIADHDLSRNDDTRVYNSFVGTARRLKQDAMDIALTIAGNKFDELWEHGEAKLIAA